MALKPSMDIKPNRPVRVGTRMMRSGKDGEVKAPTIEEYSKELDGLTAAARKAAAGEAHAPEVRAPAPEPKEAPKPAQKK